VPLSSHDPFRSGRHIGAAADASAIIRLLNYREGDTLRYSVALLKGELIGGDSISVVNTSASPPRPMQGLVHKGRFKVLCELTPGVNRLQLKSGSTEMVLTLLYVPQTNPYIVRLIYMTDEAGDTHYQSPRKDDPQNYQDRLSTAMKLMQTMTAERMDELGFGRRTFNIELDGVGPVRVHLVKGQKPAAEYYKLNDQLWYRQVASEVEKIHPTTRAKNVVIAAYTRFDPETGKMLGHTALGGGGQGLFGSGNLFTWPASIAEAQAAFMDTTPIDRKKVMSDSVGRHTFWGAASTTIGATLHEMGHTFGLPHTNDRLDIMTRGFDHFNRVFTFVDPHSAANPKPIEFNERDVAAFTPISAAALITSPWFALDAPPPAGANKITVAINKKDQKIVATSPLGIRYIGGRKSGDMHHFAAPPASQPAPTIFRADLEPFLKAIGEKGNLVILDSAGHRRETVLVDLPAEKEE
jgi:hypothetical protein